MTTRPDSLRSPLAKVRGLGSAKSGTGHWMAQRITALALIPLVILLVMTFMDRVVFGDFTSAFLWLHSPLIGAFMVMFLTAGFYHAVLGIQVVIEDYVHCEKAKLASLICVKFIACLFFVLGIIAILRIQLMEISAHV
jgi:succinate dehydrogenase / fumarate reductase membrane anchor subunit